MQRISSEILIIEDDGMITMVLEDFLEDLGHVVAGTAASVEQAMTFLMEGRPDAAIVDLRLGGSNSYPVMQRLKVLGIPFAVASGFGADIDWTFCSDDPVIIPKPFVMEDIEAALAKLLF